MQQRSDINPKKTWLIADTHFGHENIKQFCHRPQDVEQIMMEEWARAIGPEDTALHLGDLSYRNNAFFKHMIAKHLTGDKKLVKGNHDKGRPSFYRDSGFKIIKPFWIPWTSHETGNSFQVQFSHYPWRLEDGPIPENVIRIHGHIHNNGYDRDVFRPYRRNQINVSAEMMKYKPVNLLELLRAAL